MCRWREIYENNKKKIWRHLITTAAATAAKKRALIICIAKRQRSTMWQMKCEENVMKLLHIYKEFFLLNRCIYSLITCTQDVPISHGDEMSGMRTKVTFFELKRIFTVYWQLLYVLCGMCMLDLWNISHFQCAQRTNWANREWTQKHLLYLIGIKLIFFLCPYCELYAFFRCNIQTIT